MRLGVETNGQACAGKTIATAMDFKVRAAAVARGPVCGRARKGAGDRQRSITALISIMAAAPRDVVASSAAAHSTTAFGAPARRRRLLPRSDATRSLTPRSTDGRASSPDEHKARARVVRGAARRPVRGLRADGGGSAGRRRRSATARPDASCARRGHARITPARRAAAAP